MSLLEIEFDSGGDILPFRFSIYMASFENPLYRACSALHSFRTPMCRNSNGLDFAASFVCSTNSPESTSLITNLNTLRKQMCGELASPTSTNTMRLTCVDAYLPHVCNLLDSLNKQPPVPLEKQLIFEWVGAFAPNALVFNQSSEVIFELGMVLHTKAILHYMVAFDMLQGDIISNVTAAGQNLRTAAGIMRHLAVELLPKWLGANGKAGRPLELTEEVCLAYEQLFTASAQQMAVVKAMTKVGGTPVSLLIKLVLGVSSIITGNYDPNSLDAAVKNHYSYMRELFLAMAYKYQADTYASKTEVGIAIAFARQSQVWHMNRFYCRSSI